MAPVIGVTATIKADLEQVSERPLGRYVRADLDYVDAVAQAGGVPAVLPPVAASVETLLSGLDGLLLSGGTDLHPSYYGEEPHPELNETIPERDEFEMALLEGALGRRIPVFGICRGLQVINAALGGTLYQDLPSQLGGEVLLGHRQVTPKWEPTHEVAVSAGSQVARILGSREFKVNSYHHQAVKDLASGLVAVAHSPDGVVEAIEHRDLSERWLVGVQWHAEAMRDNGSEHRNLFAAHVAAAERRALGRAAA
jgi:putative glutamine amidotransferase